MNADALYEALRLGLPHAKEREADVSDSLGLSRQRLYDVLGDLNIRSEDRGATELLVAGFTTQGRLETIWGGMVDALRVHSPRGTAGTADLCHVRSLESGTSGAFTMEADDGPLIVVDSATIDIANELARAIIATAQIKSKPVADSETAARVVRVTLGHLRFVGELWQPFLFDLRGDHQAILAEALNASVEFVLAHEYAHCVLGHFQDRTVRLPFGPAADVPDWGSQEQELDADRFATAVVMSPQATDGTILVDDLSVVRLFGIQITLEAMSLLDDAFFALRSDSHPPATERFTAVLDHLGLPEPLLSEHDAFWLIRATQVFRESLRCAPSVVDELSVRVAADPVVSLAATYDADELDRVVAIDEFESLRYARPERVFAELARMTMGEDGTPPHPGAMEGGQSFGLPQGWQTRLGESALAVQGYRILIERLERELGKGWLESFLSPRRGTPNYPRFLALSDALPNDLYAVVALCLEHMRLGFEPGGFVRES